MTGRASRAIASALAAGAMVAALASPGSAEPDAPAAPLGPTTTTSAATTPTTADAGPAPTVSASPTVGDAVVTAAATTRNYTFTDVSRPTPCSGAATRTLAVTVEYPSTGTGFPVVIIGPGTGFGQRAVARTEADALAARGYFAIALVFPCSNAPGASLTDTNVLLDYYRQPADVSFVLGQLLAKSASIGDELEGLMDPTRIGYKGYSGGAVTGLLFFNACCTDARIRSIVAIKGFALPTGPSLPVNGAYDWSRALPLFMINACNDPIIPYDSAHADFLSAASPKFFTQDPSGGHTPPALLAPDTYPAFLARYVAGDASAGPLGVLLSATSDPLFAYDFGAAGPVRTTLPPCVRFTG